MTNKELATEASALGIAAPLGSPQRKAWLCAAVALGTTTTTAAARKVLAEWDGPADVRDRAIDYIKGACGCEAQ